MKIVDNYYSLIQMFSIWMIFLENLTWFLQCTIFKKWELKKIIWSHCINPIWTLWYFFFLLNATFSKFYYGKPKWDFKKFNSTWCENFTNSLSLIVCNTLNWREMECKMVQNLLIICWFVTMVMKNSNSTSLKRNIFNSKLKSMKWLVDPKFIDPIPVSILPSSLDLIVLHDLYNWIYSPFVSFKWAFKHTSQNQTIGILVQIFDLIPNYKKNVSIYFLMSSSQKINN